MERLKMKSDEREALGRLAVAQNIMMEAPAYMTERTKLIKRGSWYLAVAKSCLIKYMDAIYKTVTIEQLKSFINTLNMTSYYVGAKCPARTYDNPKLRKETGMWVSYDALDNMIDACREKCQLCGLDRGRQKSCPLRKALDTIPNDAPDDGGDGCPYYGVM